MSTIRHCNLKLLFRTQKEIIAKKLLHTQNSILQQQMDLFEESRTSQPAEQSSQT